MQVYDLKLNNNHINNKNEKNNNNFNNDNFFCNCCTRKKR